MNKGNCAARAASASVGADDVDDVLAESYYRPGPAAAGRDKPSHYKVICISMYTQDLTKLDAMVDELKARGLTKASRSALIRFALSGVDLEKVPRGL
jgi:hypothetical protein